MTFCTLSSVSLNFKLCPTPGATPANPTPCLDAPVQVRKTLDATMQTLQDMLTVEDFDVSDAFQHSRSTESIKSLASESYMSKMNVAKRRSNQQETETFYFSVGGVKIGRKLEPQPLLGTNSLFTFGFQNSAQFSDITRKCR